MASSVAKAIFNGIKEKREKDKLVTTLSSFKRESQECPHDFKLVGRSLFSNKPWYDCKHCGKKKEDC